MNNWMFNNLIESTDKEELKISDRLDELYKELDYVESMFGSGSEEMRLVLNEINELKKEMKR